MLKYLKAHREDIERKRHLNSKSILSRAFSSAQNAKLNHLKIFRDKVAKWLRRRIAKEFVPLTFGALSIRHSACFEDER